MTNEVDYNWVEWQKWSLNSAKHAFLQNGNDIWNVDDHLLVGIESQARQY